MRKKTSPSISPHTASWPELSGFRIDFPWAPKRTLYPPKRHFVRLAMGARKCDRRINSGGRVGRWDGWGWRAGAVGLALGLAESCHLLNLYGHVSQRVASFEAVGRGRRGQTSVFDPPRPVLGRRRPRASGAPESIRERPLSANPLESTRSIGAHKKPPPAGGVLTKKPPRKGADFVGSGGRTRTYNKRINSPLLCRLSYAGA